jgi:hypothetical protein
MVTDPISDREDVIDVARSLGLRVRVDGGRRYAFVAPHAVRSLGTAHGRDEALAWLEGYAAGRENGGWRRDLADAFVRGVRAGLGRAVALDRQD